MSENDEKQFITLEEIINAEAVQELYIKVLDKWVKIKNASTNDRITAEKMAMKHPSWPLMTAEDRNIEVSKMISLQILVDPVISYEDYTTSSDMVMQVIISAVVNEYQIKLSKLTEQGGANLKRFLEQILGEEAMNSLSSLNSVTSTSQVLERSGEE